jgi:predicted phosphodiesterase
MKKWCKETIDYLLQLKGEGYSEQMIAEQMSYTFTEYRYTKDAVGNVYRRIKSKLIEVENEEDQNEEYQNEEYQKEQYQGKENQNDVVDFEIDSQQYLSLTKKVQRLSDTNRIERKVWRNSSRYESFYEVYMEKLIALFKDKKNAFKIAYVPQKDYTVNEKCVGILHLSDLHFNEIVDETMDSFDFDVASCRLKKFVNEAVKEFKVNNVGKVVVACTGDFINSDRHIDEMTSMATARAVSVFIGVRLLEYVLLDLLKHFEVVFTGVSGNESRIQLEMGYSNMSMSDNYDATIYNILSYIFKNEERIQFVLENYAEQVISINNINILLFHGYSLKNTTDYTKEIATLFSKYAKNGIELRFVIFGHYHSSVASTDFARSGALTGNNSFSNYKLNFNTRASQNLYIVKDNGDINSIVIDLQNYNPNISYDIEEEKIKFNVRSSVAVNKTNVVKVF